MKTVKTLVLIILLFLGAFSFSQILDTRNKIETENLDLDQNSIVIPEKIKRTKRRKLETHSIRSRFKRSRKGNKCTKIKKSCKKK